VTADGLDDAIGWRPTLSRAAAEAWGAHSVYPEPVYHATTADTAAIIRQEGFNLDRQRFGRFWGNGVYGTTDSAIAARYAAALGSGAQVLELRLNVRRVLSVHLSQRHPASAIEQVLAPIPNGFARYVEIGEALRTGRSAVDPRAEALTRLMREAGYDVLEIVEPGFTPAVGGAQVVIFDPRMVVVIDEERDE